MNLKKIMIKKIKIKKSQVYKYKFLEDYTNFSKDININIITNNYN